MFGTSEIGLAPRERDLDAQINASKSEQFESNNRQLPSHCGGGREQMQCFQLRTDHTNRFRPEKFSGKWCIRPNAMLLAKTEYLHRIKMETTMGSEST